MVRDITYVGERLIPAPLNGAALRYTPLPKGDVTDIAVHHWTGPLPPATWTAREEIAYIVRINQYHYTDRGLDGIGYQVCPFPSGRVYIVSRLDRYGAHVGGQNNHLIGLGLPGSFHNQAPSPKHLAATVEAVKYIYGYLGRDVPTTPHLAWGGTNCPGARWREWVPQLREQALQEDDMALTDEQHAMLQTIHHMAKLVTPEKLEHIHAHVKALEDKNVTRYNQLRKEIAALDTDKSGAHDH